jgi:bifunctional non-homologous end joining protein LigD
LPVARALETTSLEWVIDGELVALDAHGRSRFQLLQNALRQKSNLRYYVFDRLFAGGKDVRELPLLERKKILQQPLPRSGLVQLSVHRPEYGKQYFKEAKKAGQEGIIAKRVDSTYQSGVRSSRSTGSSDGQFVSLSARSSSSFQNASSVRDPNNRAKRVLHPAHQ